MNRLGRQVPIRVGLRAAAAVGAAAGAVVAPSVAQCQLAKAVASDGGAIDIFGERVAAGPFGVMVGARRHSHHYERSGGVYVFENTVAGLSQVVELTFLPGEGVGFGKSVAVQDALAAVGAVGYWPTVFERRAGAWERIQQLRPVGGFPTEFGAAISVDDTGIVVGAPEDSNENGGGAGSAYVFERDPNGVWLQSAKLLASDGTGGDALGTSVAIHDDVIVVGAPEDDPFGLFNTGSAYVFERDPNAGWAETAKLLPDQPSFLQSFGEAVAALADVVMVGAFFDNTQEPYTGAVYVYERDGAGGWLLTERLTASDGGNAHFFGISLALDGDLAVIGAENADTHIENTGAAYVFHRQPDGSWVEVGKVFAADGAFQDEFGRSVALSGNLAVVGAPFHDIVDSGGNTQVDAGAAYVFAVGPDRDENGVMDVCECRAAVEGVGAASGDDQSRDRQGAVEGSPRREGRDGNLVPAVGISSQGYGGGGGFVASPDLDLDQRVGMGDLLILLANFGHDRDNPPAGHSPPHAALHEYGDLDLDQDIDLADLALMLAAYDRACE